MELHKHSLPWGYVRIGHFVPTLQLEMSPAVLAPRGLVTHHGDDLVRKTFPKQGLPLAQSSLLNWHLADPQQPPTSDASGAAHCGFATAGGVWLHPERVERGGTVWFASCCNFPFQSLARVHSQIWGANLEVFRLVSQLGG